MGPLGFSSLKSYFHGAIIGIPYNVLICAGMLLSLSSPLLPIAALYGNRETAFLFLHTPFLSAYNLTFWGNVSYIVQMCRPVRFRDLSLIKLPRRTDKS